MLAYLVPVFLGAFLLFQVQPIIARCILPWFGGTPSVWTTCMLFFQVLLLVGYAYAHLLIARLTPRRQALVHTCLLVASVAALAVATVSWRTPIVPGPGWKPHGSDQPVLHILAILAVAVGLPYLVLSTTSPLLQAWFARTHVGRSPYRLYTLSNAGSLLGLLSYPFLVEPSLTLRSQGWLWAGGYLLFSSLYVACAVRAGRRLPAVSADPAPAVADGPNARPITWSDRILWVAFPTLASVMLLAVTNQICQEVAVIPFLWILPLSLYLLSFMICFDNERWYVPRIFAVLLGCSAYVVAMVVLPKTLGMSQRIQIPVYALTLFLCCMVCHGETVRRKPSPRYLTSFYLAIATGGALGGVLVGVLAPRVFHWMWELNLGLLLSLVAAVVALWNDEGLGRPIIRQPALAFCAVLMIGTALSPSLSPLREDKYIVVSRNFYGILRVTDDDAQNPLEHKHTLVHGKTTHGFQFVSPHRRRLNTSYYAPDSGVGLAVLHHPRRLALRPEDQTLRIAVVGLGTGTMASYAQAGDLIRFYEINPAVRRLAWDPACFTYLRDAEARGARVEIVMGDARISMERELQQEGSQQFDVIVLDAFSSDSIPAHLLTREAVAVYLQHLRQPGGIVAVHLSNRALDLRLVSDGLARDARMGEVLVNNEGDNEVTYDSDWMLLTHSRTFLADPEVWEAKIHYTPPKKIRLWTDDFHNLFQILK